MTEIRLKEFMTTKSALQNILEGILQTEMENKSIHETREKNKPHEINS